MSLSLMNYNNPSIIKYKFTKFDPNAGRKLSVSKNVQYFADCVYSSKNLKHTQITTIRQAMREWEKITNIKFIYEENEPKLFITATDLNQFNNNKAREILGAGW
jgi:hypothetical protein